MTRHGARPLRTALRAALVVLALVAPGAPGWAEEDRCYVGGSAGIVSSTPRLRMALIRVVFEDADGRPIDGLVEVDGVAVGPTGRALRIPVCAKHLRVTAGARAAEQNLALQSGEFTTLHARLGAAPLAAAPAAPVPGPAAPPAHPAHPAGAAAAATSAEPFHGASLKTVKPPDDQVAIHYHRRDGKYAGWGLHVWESFGDAPDRPLPGVTWDAPLKPTGRDEFGVYWFLPADAFGNGSVNFIVHSKAGDKEHCGQDERFNATMVREVWVVTGECEAFRSRDEAIEAARKR